MKTLISNWEHNKIMCAFFDDHVRFFSTNSSGCAFAVQAARDPQKYEWGSRIIRSGNESALDEIIASAIGDPSISTLSVIFPDVVDEAGLWNLIPLLNQSVIYLFETFDTEANRCYRFRVKVGEEESLISGFAPFTSMPITRRAPHVALVMRLKARPDYDWYLKEPEPGIIHVADMDMKGTSDRLLKRMWKNSFFRTRGLLGKKPDDESAARTTFLVPLAQADRISV